MKYFLLNWPRVEGDLILIRKRMVKWKVATDILATQKDGEWMIWPNHHGFPTVDSEGLIKISKEEAVMILFHCKESI